MKSWIPNSIGAQRIQSWIILAFIVFFVAQISLLSPAELETDSTGMRTLSKPELIEFFQTENSYRAEGVPKNKTPSYGMRNFEGFLVGVGSPNTKIFAKKALSYDEEKIIHAFQVRAEIYDAEKPTLVSGIEGKVDTVKKTIELFGDVEIFYPDGSWVKTDRAMLVTSPEKQIYVPLHIQVIGSDGKSGSKSLNFEGYGLKYEAHEDVVHLLKNSVVRMEDGVKKTIIRSDWADVDRPLAEIRFGMVETRPLREQFVTAEQSDLTMKSRKMRATSEDKLHIDTAYATGDVEIIDARNPDQITRSTSGRATLKNKTNEVILTDFPQVYQNDDTITGERIIIHRDTDVIEVDQSNAKNRK